MDLEERVRLIETELILLKLGRRQSNRLILIIVLCLIAAIPTMGIALLAMLAFLIWHFNLCSRERAAISEQAPGAPPPAIPAYTAPAHRQAPAPPGAGGLQLKPYDFEKNLVRPALLAVGTIALLLSAAFFMALPDKAIALSHTVRLFLIILGGIGLVFAGDAQFKRLPSFGYALLGGGLGLLIISVYGVLTSQKAPSQLLAFAFLLAVTAAMVFLAVRHNSWILAALGLCGGMLGPVYVGVRMIESVPAGTQPAALLGDYATVAVYLLVLALAAFLLSLYKNWHSLPLLVILFAYGSLGTLYQQVAPSARLLALAALFLLFLLGSLYRALRFQVAAEPMEMLVLLANGVLFMIFGMEGVYTGQPAAQGTVGTACAILLALLAAILPVAGPRKRLMETLCAMSLFFLGVSLVFLLETDYEAAGTMLVAVLTLWLADRFNSAILRILGAIATYWGLGMLLFMELLPATDTWEGGALRERGTTPYLHAGFMIELAVVAAAFLALWLWHRAARRQSSPGERAFVSLGVVAANFVLVFLLQVESAVWGLLPSAQAAGWSGILKRAAGVASYLVHGGILTFLGMKRESPLLRYCGLALLVWTVLWVGFGVIVYGELLARVIALVILGAALVAVSFWYYRRFSEARE